MPHTRSLVTGPPSGPAPSGAPPSPAVRPAPGSPGPERSRSRVPPGNSTLSPAATTAMMIAPPSSSAKANFQPTKVQNITRIAMFMLVELIRNENAARASAPRRYSDRVAAAEP